MILKSVKHCEFVLSATFYLCFVSYHVVKRKVFLLADKCVHRAQKMILFFI